MPHEQGHVLTPEQDQELQRRKKFLRDLGLSEDLAVMPGLEKLPTQAPAPQPMPTLAPQPAVAPMPDPLGPEGVSGAPITGRPTTEQLKNLAATGQLFNPQTGQPLHPLTPEFIQEGTREGFLPIVTGQKVGKESVALLTSKFGERSERARALREQGMPTFLAAMQAQEDVSLPSANVPLLPFSVPLPGGRSFQRVDLGVQGALELALDPWNVGLGVGAVGKLGAFGARQAVRAGGKAATREAVAASPDVSLQFAKREVTRLEQMRQNVSGASRRAIDDKLRQEREKIVTLEARIADEAVTSVGREAAEEIEQLQSRLVDIERQLQSGMPDELLEAPGGRRPFAQFEMPEGQVGAAMERLAIEEEQITARLRELAEPLGPTPSEMDAIAEGVAGLSVMSDLSNFDEIVGIMTRPDVWREIANLPVVSSIQRRFNPSAVANDPVTQSIVGRAMLRDQARQLTQRTNARLGAIGTQEQVFGKLTQEGLIAGGPLKGLTVNTVRTYPERYAAQTTPEMKEWIRVADDVEKAKLDYLQTNNIKINELAFDEGGQYAGRRIWGRYNSKNDLTAIGITGAGPGRVGAKLGQEKERFFKTAEEAIEKGYRYIPDDEALYLNVQAAYNRVADERMADWLLERIDWRTTSMPEGVRIARVKAERRVALAKRSIDALHRAMRGESLPTGTVNAIERLFPQLEGRLREPTRIRIADVLKAAKALEQPERVLEVPSIGAIRKMQKLIQEAEDSLAANPLNPALQRKVSRLRSSLGFIRYRIGLGEPLTLPHNVVKELRRDALDDLRELRDAIRGTRVKRPGQATPRFEGGLIAEVRRELDEATKKATEASKQAKKISAEEGTVQAPRFTGKVFDAETARILRESLNPDFNKTLGSINQFNAVSRFFMLGGDASPFTIQLLFLAGGDPVVYGKAIGGFVNAMRSTRFQNKYLAKPENQAILAKYPNLVLLKGGATEYTEAMGRGGILSTQRALLPPGESALKQAALLGPRGIAKVGATMTRPFARGFEGAMDVAGIEMAKALDHHGTTPARIDDLTQFINEFRGVTSAERLGVSKIHQQQETASLLASRYTRAVSSLLFDIVHGGLRGQLARTAMARGVAAIAAMTVAVSYSMGEDEKDIINHLTPGHPMFMTWRIGGQNIGPGSKVRSIMNLFAKSAADPNKLRDTSIGWGALEYMKNPILRFYRAQAAPAISFGYDLLSGKDYIGDPTRDGLMSMSETVAKRFMWIWAQTMAFEGGTPLGRAGRGVGEFLGLRASPRNIIWEVKDQWRPDMKAYMDIPSDPLERYSKGIKVDRTRYRRAHPEIDAKLWITGEVTTLKSSAASNIVRELVKQYEIDPVNIKGVQQHQKQKARMAELGVIRFTPGGASESQKIMDRLIRYLTMPEPVAQEPTPVPTGVPQ